MTPVSDNPGYVPSRTAPAARSAGFSSRMQAVLQQFKPAVVDQGPSRATIGHLHPGGMNDAALQLLKLNGGARR